MGEFDDLRAQVVEDIFQPLSKEELKVRQAEVVRKRLESCVQNSDGTYSCEGDVDLSGLNLTSLPVRFKKVGGNIYCSNNHLTTLKGAPEYVPGHFFCHTNNLTTLKGAPEYVGGYFFCEHNQLTSLEGAPKKVGGYFFCGGNSVPEKELLKTIDRPYI